MKATITDLRTLPAALNVEQAAAALGLSKNGTYEAVRRGEIPHVRIGARIVIPRAAIERLLQVSGAP